MKPVHTIAFAFATLALAALPAQAADKKEAAKDTKANTEIGRAHV